MRLLYLHNTPLDSEKANIVSTLYMCNAFSNLGLEVTLAVPKPKSYITDREISTSIKNIIGQENSFSLKFFRKYTFAGRFNTLGAFWGIKKLLKEESTDICFVRSPVFKITIDAGIPTIFECHNSLLNTRSKILDRYWKGQLFKLCKYDKFLKMIAISQELSNFWQNNGFPPSKILTLHDCIDDGSHKNIESIEEARDELNLPKDRKLIVYAGSLYRDRGIETILKLAQVYSMACFIVLGGPDERKRYYRKMLEKEGINNVYFMGYIPHNLVKSYLCAADVLLMIWSRKVPTINYCSPLKMFEYMAANRIIVGHGFPTIKEILTDGETAYLANPDSFDELSAKLNNALNDTYPSIIADNARKLVLSHYTWDKKAKAILQSINST
jgi:glycosyltransferase involved in cell wall biosynthesis